MFLGAPRARGITERDAREHGLTTEDMDAVYRDRVRRRALLYGVRRARPKGAGPPLYHREWAEQVDYVRAELALDHKRKNLARVVMRGILITV